MNLHEVNDDTIEVKLTQTVHEITERSSGMNRTDYQDNSATDQEHKRAIDWDYNNTVEGYNFYDMDGTKFNDAASNFARLVVLLRDNVQIKAYFIASRR